MDLKIDQTLSSMRIAGSTDPQSLNRLANIPDQQARAEAIASQLESVFFGMMIKAMRATVPDGGIDGRGLGRSQYVQMLDQHFAELGAMPRDPRFHESLVRQILDDPAAASRMLSEGLQSQPPTSDVEPTPLLK